MFICTCLQASFAFECMHACIQMQKISNITSGSLKIAMFSDVESTGEPEK